MKVIVILLLSSRLLTPQSAVHIMAVEQGVDPHLAACIVTHESGWDAELVGDAGDSGLFQIIPSTAEWVAGKLGYEQYDLTDVATNAEMGLYILDTYPGWYAALPKCEEAE